MDGEVLHFISQYGDMLERFIIMDSEIQQECEEIFFLYNARFY